ncbi:MAG: chemotaxis-specific protein-glutamate methyltransferase CheB [Cyanobacteria bacterium J06632_3]
MITVGIANDTIIALEALRRVIATNPAYKIIWCAGNGQEAIVFAQKHTPDLLLMDLLMPGVDGVEATRQIMTRSPCAILLVTASLTNNVSKVFEAMRHGALDVVSTPILGLYDGAALAEPIAQPLLDKMAMVTAIIGKSVRRGNAARVHQSCPVLRSALPQLVVIGSSTGGPKALCKILSQIPTSAELAIVVVQHIDKQFAAGLASWLDSQTSLSVAVARSGDRAKPGQVLIAETNEHLVMKSDHTLTYQNVAHSHPHRPSVDIFFESVARHWQQPAQAVLLTGMGRDGAMGMNLLHSAGWHTIAESQKSCVVYGMPRAAIEMGAATEILPVSEIASALMRSPTRLSSKKIWAF